MLVKVEVGLMVTEEEETDMIANEIPDHNQRTNLNQGIQFPVVNRGF